MNGKIIAWIVTLGACLGLIKPVSNIHGKRLGVVFLIGFILRAYPLFQWPRDPLV